MLNLIRKDILLQKNTLLILLPVLFINLFSGSSAIWIGIVFCIAIIMNAFAYDEKSSVNFLLNSLPYSRKEIVSSKYIGAGVFTGLVLLTIFMGNLIIHREVIPWEKLLIIVSIVLVYISFAFPFSYLFKSQYLLVASGIAFVIYMIVVNTLVVDLNDRLRELIQGVLSLNNSQMYPIIMITVIIIYIFSWLLSMRIYSKKVF